MRHYTDPEGNQFWSKKNGELHRTDGPAIIFADKSRHWFQNGKRHRTDGPAYVEPKTLGYYFRNFLNVEPNFSKYWVDGINFSNKVMSVLLENLTPADAIACYLAHPNLTTDNIEKITGWKTSTTPTEQQLDTWRMMAGLKAL